MNKDMNKNLKDSNDDSIKDTNSPSSSLVPAWTDRSKFYSKTDKLITALYMVTDIIDTEEPIRHKLRILGTEIISDMHSVTPQVGNKITEVVSFLNVASAMNFISEMNCAILKKEFLELNKSIHENLDMKPTWLEDFLVDPQAESGGGERSGSVFSSVYLPRDKGHHYPKGQTRIGVQKAGTLMQALSDKTYLMSGNNSERGTATNSGTRQNFDILRRQRREDILNIIKNNNGSATIKDIKVKINNGTSGSPIYGEKTLQRELMSMAKDGVLEKTGEKRWSRYFLKS